MSSDLYSILGVPRQATADEVKKAYRKLARELHPDVNPSKEAPKRFAEVQKAYEILSDDAKRQTYDQFGTDAFDASGAAHPRPSRPRNAKASVSVDGFDFDPDDLSSVFESIFTGVGGAGAKGQGRRSAGSKRRAARTHFEPVRMDVDVDFLVAAKGGMVNLSFQINGVSRKVEVQVPAGTDHGSQLRVQGPFGPEGESVEVLLTIRVGQHSIFSRGEGDRIGTGLDLKMVVPVTIAEATLGALVALPTLTGKVDLSVPPGSSAGRRLRLRGLGIKDAHGKTGDLYAEVRIVSPDPVLLSPEDKEALLRLAALTPAVRTGSDWNPDTRV